MKKTSIMWRILLSIIVIVLLIELTFVIVSKGNVGVDLLFFSRFEKKEPYKSGVILNDNQYVKEGFVCTIILDSIDFALYIDDKIIKQDTIYERSGIKYFRENYCLKPGRHSIRIESKKLDATYSYPFHNFLFIEIFVESDIYPPYFWISKHYFPLRRNEI